MAQKYNQAHSIVFERGWSESSKKLDKRKKKKEEKATSQNPKSYSIEKGESPITSISHFLIFSSIFYDYPSSQVKGFVSILFFTNIKIEWTQTRGL